MTPGEKLRLALKTKRNNTTCLDYTFYVKLDTIIVDVKEKKKKSVNNSKTKMTHKFKNKSFHLFF